MSLLNSYIDEAVNMPIGESVENVEPLFEAWNTGETNDMFRLLGEFNSSMREVDEGVIYADSFATIAESKGNIEKSELLIESTIKDYFTKFINAIKKLWAKTKAFITNLLKSIQVSIVDVNKSLQNIDKYISGKDLSKLTYLGYEWTDTNISQEIAKNSLAAITIINGSAKYVQNQANKLVSTNGNSLSKAGTNTIDAITNDDKSRKLIKMGNFGTVMGANDAITQAEMNDQIKAAYGCRDTKSELKVDQNKLKSMITFLKGFNGNATLKNLKKNTDSVFSNTIKGIQDMQSSVNNLSSGNEKGQKIVSQCASALRSLCSSAQGIVSAFNSAMGVCIQCEKSRFSEYRSVVASAIRYNKKPEN